MIKAPTGEKFHFPEQETINLKNNDTNQNDRFNPKRNVTVKSEAMKKIILTKNVEWPE